MSLISMYPSVDARHVTAAPHISFLFLGNSWLFFVSRVKRWVVLVVVKARVCPSLETSTFNR